LSKSVFPVLPEWLVLRVFKAHRDQEGYKAFVVMLGLMVFPVATVKTEQRETRGIVVRKAHKVPWGQEAIRENKAHRVFKAKRVQLVLMESRDQRDLKAILAFKDRKEIKVYPEKRENREIKAQKVLLVHKDHKENRVQLVLWDHKDSKDQRGLKGLKVHRDPKENKVLRVKME